MKKALLLILALVISSVIGGITAHLVTMKSISQVAQEITSGHTDEVLCDNLNDIPAHFTSYQKESYPDLTYAAENAVKAVVNIEVIQMVSGKSYGDSFFEFFGIPQEYGHNSERRTRSGGSGVIISPDGYIVTNHHVVENASELKVKLNDGRTFDAEIVGTYPTTEIALIKIDAKSLPTLVFGSSDALRLGEWVLAIGSPFDLQSTITAGIVSAKARDLKAISNQSRIESFIQTDAAVNPGNSGGALVNTKGELVGINTLIKSQTGSYIGYSFAVPSSIAQKITADLKEFGVVQRAMLGIQYQEINDVFIEQFGEEYNIGELGGIYIVAVEEGSAAEDAGIKSGDILLSINDLKINSSSTLLETIARYRPNDKVKISIKRENKVKHFNVTLRSRAGKAELLTKDDVDAFVVLGGEFAEINVRIERELGIDGGIKVTSVREDGLLARARIKAGYIITHINEMKINSVSDLNKIDEKITLIDGIYPNGRAICYSLVE